MAMATLLNFQPDPAIENFQTKKLALILRCYSSNDRRTVRPWRSPVAKHKPPGAQPIIKAHGERIHHHFFSRKDARSWDVSHAQSQKTIRHSDAIEKTSSLIRPTPALPATLVDHKSPKCY